MDERSISKTVRSGPGGISVDLTVTGRNWTEIALKLIQYASDRIAQERQFNKERFLTDDCTVQELLAALSQKLGQD